MNLLNSKHYPRIMYLALIVVSLLILFNLINIIDIANDKIKDRSLTGFAIENNNNNTSNNSTTDKSSSKKSELYTSRSYMIFYSFIIGLIVAIFITFLILRSTINKNIELEEKARKF